MSLGKLLNLSDSAFNCQGVGGEVANLHLPGLSCLPNELMAGESFVNHELCRCVGMFQGVGITVLGLCLEWIEPLMCIQMCVCASGSDEEHYG